MEDEKVPENLNDITVSSGTTTVRVADVMISSDNSLDVVCGCIVGLLKEPSVKAYLDIMEIKKKNGSANYCE